MGVTVGGAKDSWDTLVAVTIIEEIVINREEGGAAWWREKRQLRQQQMSSIHTNTHEQNHKSNKRVSTPIQIKQRASPLWNVTSLL